MECITSSYKIIAVNPIKITKSSTSLVINKLFDICLYRGSKDINQLLTIGNSIIIYYLNSGQIERVIRFFTVFMTRVHAYMAYENK